MKKLLTKSIIITVFILSVFYVVVVRAETLAELNQRIAETKKQVEELTKRANTLQQQINAQRDKKVTLESEVQITNQRIEKINIQLQYTSLDIDRTQLEIDQIDGDLVLKEEELKKEKESIKNMLRNMYTQKNTSQLEILLSVDSLGSFFNKITQLSQIESVLNEKAKTLTQIQKELSDRKEEKTKKRDELELLKQQLVTDAQLLDDIQIQKNYLLSETKNNEKRFQQLYAQAVKERVNADAEISNIESAIRKKLREEGLKRIGGDGSFDWPVPSRYVTTRFHDPGYPFKKVFQHSGIDIRAAQGTNILAAQDGYVAKVNNGGLYGYSYILLIHANGKSSVYGHVSRILVKEDTYVAKGEKIGLSGGMPGTPGAGSYTTAPHLHFEIRDGGIPIDPLLYLSSPITLD